MSDFVPGIWETPQKILVILAHPDDPEFFCGGTLARWAQAGHEIHYCLLTCGDKGSDDPNISTDDLCLIRHKEQENAAKIIGAKSVSFLDHPDGYLVPDISLRRDVTRVIRQFAPDVLVTCDPTNIYPGDGYPLNHPDHRAAGQAVLDAVFPASGSHLFFPELLDEGFAPHRPNEVWISVTNQANTVLDVTDTWEKKIQAVLEHKSQIADPESLIDRMKNHWKTSDSSEEEPRYEEEFHVIRWK